MSDKPISVGDLVQVVAPPLCPEGRDKWLGHIFTVRSIGSASMMPRPWCSYCGSRDHLEGDVYAEDLPTRWFPLPRLKRIPPLEELEGEKREEKEPA